MARIHQDTRKHIHDSTTDNSILRRYKGPIQSMKNTCAFPAAVIKYHLEKGSSSRPSAGAVASGRRFGARCCHEQFAFLRENDWIMGETFARDGGSLAFLQAEEGDGQSLCSVIWKAPIRCWKSFGRQAPDYLPKRRKNVWRKTAETNWRNLLGTAG